MPIVSFNNVGKVGIVPDINPVELPPEAWSNGQNVRFIDGKAEKFTGHTEVFASPKVPPYWLLPVALTDAYYWVYAGLNKVYATDGANHYNITRQSGGSDDDYAATADLNWTGGVLGGIPVLNNGLDDPQVWLPPNASTRLASLPYDSGSTWADKSYTARVLRPFKQYLVALAPTKAGTEFPYLVKWSHPADPGAVPISWDEADTTMDAGEADLPEGGELVDCAPLRDINVIYARNAVWGMQHTGGPFVFRFHKMFSSIGAVSRRCVQEFDGRHIVFTPGDLVVHDGQRVESLVDNRTRRWLINNVDETYFGRSFIVPNFMQDEMWVCFPSPNASLPDRALVWNFRDGTFGVRDLPGAPHIGFGVVNPSESQVWDDDHQVWDDDDDTWNTRAYNPVAQTNLICDPGQEKLYQANVTHRFNGVDMTAYLERTGLHTFDIGGRAYGGMDTVKHVSEIWPRFEGVGTVEISVGAQQRPGDAITWGPPRPFVIGSQRKVDVRATGRLIAVRFESRDNSRWRLTGYDMRVDLAGRR